MPIQLLRLLCLTLLAACSPVLYPARQASAQPLCNAAPPAPSLRAPFSKNVTGFFPWIDEQSAQCGLKPLRSYTVPQGDLAVRIWCSLGYERFPSYAFRRTDGVWSGLLLAVPQPQGVRCHFQMPLDAPKGGWENLWNQLVEKGIETLPDQSTLNDGHLSIVDGDVYLIEINGESGYWAYTYSNPGSLTLREDKQMAAIIKAVQSAFDRHAGFEGIAPLSSEAERHLMGDDFHTFRDIRKVPGWVQESTSKWGYRLTDHRVNPGQAWPKKTNWLKPQRLIFVATAGDYCLLVYEQGGKDKTRNALLFHKVHAGDFDVVIEGSAIHLSERTRSLSDLRALQKKSGIFKVRLFIR